MAKNSKQISVVMSADKECKGSIRVAENASGMNIPKIGAIYVPKTTLAEIGFSIGDRVKVTIELA